MICHMKHIFVWIFLIPQPTGNVFIYRYYIYLGLCSNICVFTFFFRFRTRSIHLTMYFIKAIFILTAADYGAFLTVYGVLIQNHNKSCSLCDEIVSMNCCK